MAPLRHIVVFATLGFSLATSVVDTPIAQVISLLSDLKEEVRKEGMAEAAEYAQFSCFCKDATMSKSEAIISGKNDINSLSTVIEERDATEAVKATDLLERRKKQEELSKDLSKLEARCAKGKAEYDAQAADISKAIDALKNAEKALEEAKPGALLSIHESVERSLALAESLNMTSKRKRLEVQTFLQKRVDPNSAEYKYHSQGIIDTIRDLNTEFTKNKEDLDAEYAKAAEVCKTSIADLKEAQISNDATIGQLETDIENLKIEIAEARKMLVERDATLKDDQFYLKDLTTLCEKRAKDWDQRTQLRGKELAALAEALEILQTEVEPADKVNLRALQLGAKSHNSNAGQLRSLSFLQEMRGSDRIFSSSRTIVSAQAKQDMIISLLEREAQRLGSTALSALALRVNADPFAKVKVIIQKLIERLLQEANDEATKKGFCDTELSKAEKDRDFRLAGAKKLNAEIAGLEVTKDELDMEQNLLEDSLSKSKTTLNTAEEQRKEDKIMNTDTVKTAKRGLAAVTQAIIILKTFYKSAAKETVFVQASPVEEDPEYQKLSFDGAYKGKQEGAKGVIGILEVIKTDFERTIRRTKAEEASQAAEFVEFDRTTRTDISGKETQQTLNSADLEVTQDSTNKKMIYLQNAMDLVDTAVKRLEALKPTCTDTTMSYEERRTKRAKEIAALNKALCILDTEGVEPDC